MGQHEAGEEAGGEAVVTAESRLKPEARTPNRQALVEEAKDIQTTLQMEYASSIISGAAHHTIACAQVIALGKTS